MTFHSLREITGNVIHYSSFLKVKLKEKTQGFEEESLRKLQKIRIKWAVHQKAKEAKSKRY